MIVRAAAMTRKRKARSDASRGPMPARKKAKGAAGPQPAARQADRQPRPQPRPQDDQPPPPAADRAPTVQQGLLARYFPRVATLRAYLLTRLPASSRLRRKKLASVGQAADASAVEQLLSHVLDTTLVACADTAGADHDRAQLHATFSQSRRADESYVTVSGAAEGVFSPQAEVRRRPRPRPRPPRR